MKIDIANETGENEGLNPEKASVEEEKTGGKKAGGDGGISKIFAAAVKMAEDKEVGDDNEGSKEYDQAGRMMEL